MDPPATTSESAFPIIRVPVCQYFGGTLRALLGGNLGPQTLHEKMEQFFGPPKHYVRVCISKHQSTGMSIFLRHLTIFQLVILHTNIQVNLFQKPLFFYQLTHNTTRDCSLNSPKNTSLEHVVYKYCFECQNKDRKTIYVHNMF